MRSYNNSEPLRINSIHLPPIKNDYTETPIQTPGPTYLTEQSTVQIREKKTTVHVRGFSFTPILLPSGNCLTIRQNHNLANSTNNVSSDTDTSLGVKCCSGLSKLKW